VFASALRSSLSCSVGVSLSILENSSNSDRSSAGFVITF
jgi:hypothetical protein